MPTFEWLAVTYVSLIRRPKRSLRSLLVEQRFLNWKGVANDLVIVLVKRA